MRTQSPLQLLKATCWPQRHSASEHFSWSVDVVWSVIRGERTHLKAYRKMYNEQERLVESEGPHT